MKIPQKHSDALFVNGMRFWTNLESIADANNMNEFLNSRFTNESDKSDIFSILRVFATTVVIEHLLILNMSKRYQSLGAAAKENVKKDVLDKIKRTMGLKNGNADAEAERLLSEQVSSSENLFTPPVLQYLAGYTLGGLINLYKKHLQINPDLEESLRKFADARNFVVHNTLSSREDIYEHIRTAIAIAAELKPALRPRI